MARVNSKLPVPTEAQEAGPLIKTLRIEGFRKKPDEHHGMSHSKEYWAWDNMLARCYRPSHKYYADYGGRGISVCQKWRMSFQEFYRDVGTRPSANHSLDRMNTDGHYEPGNVRWATATQQNLNRRLSKNNSSGYKGVSWNKYSQKWRANICFKGKQIRIGEYSDKCEAANMYDQYAVQLYGEDIRLNYEYK